MPANTGQAASSPLLYSFRLTLHVRTIQRGKEAASPVLAGGIFSSLPALGPFDLKSNMLPLRHRTFHVPSSNHCHFAMKLIDL